MVDKPEIYMSRNEDIGIKKASEKSRGREQLKSIGNKKLRQELKIWINEIE